MVMVEIPAGVFSVQKLQLMMNQLDNVASLGPMDARTVWRESLEGLEGKHVEYHSV